MEQINKISSDGDSLQEDPLKTKEIPCGGASFTEDLLKGFETHCGGASFTEDPLKKEEDGDGASFTEDPLKKEEHGDRASVEDLSTKEETASPDSDRGSSLCSAPPREVDSSDIPSVDVDQRQDRPFPSKKLSGAERRKRKKAMMAGKPLQEDATNPGTSSSSAPLRGVDSSDIPSVDLDQGQNRPFPSKKLSGAERRKQKKAMMAGKPLQEDATNPGTSSSSAPPKQASSDATSSLYWNPEHKIKLSGAAQRKRKKLLAAGQYFDPLYGLKKTAASGSQQGIISALLRVPPKQAGGSSGIPSDVSSNQNGSPPHKLSGAAQRKRRKIMRTMAMASEIEKSLQLDDVPEEWKNENYVPVRGPLAAKRGTPYGRPAPSYGKSGPLRARPGSSRARPKPAHRGYGRSRPQQERPLPSHKRPGPPHGKSGLSHERTGLSHERTGPSYEISGTFYERSGTFYERSGHSYERSGHSYERSGPLYERPGLPHERSGPLYDRPRLPLERSGPSYIMPGPSHAMPGPSHAMPGPSHAMPGPSHAMPGPSHAMPGPSHAMSRPQHAMPGPSHAMPGPSHAMSRPQHAMPGPSHAISGLQHAMPGPSHAISGLQHAMPGPRHAMPGVPHVMSGPRHAMPGVPQAMSGPRHAMPRVLQAMSGAQFEKFRPQIQAPMSGNTAPFNRPTDDPRPGPYGVPASAMKSFRDDTRPGGCGGDGSTIKMTIIKEGHPVERIVDEEIPIIQKEILRKLDAMPFGQPLPLLKHFYLADGALVYLCGSQETCHWLIGAIDRFHLRDGSTLKVIRAKTFSKPIKVAFTTRDSCTVDPQKLLIRLQTFNPNLRTDNWIVHQSSVESHGQQVVLSIDKESADYIRNAGYKAFTGIDQGTFKFLTDSFSMSSVEDGTFRGHYPG